jgi:hypothetical protein
MAHFKCATCRARIWREGDAAAHARDLCPGCAGPLVAAIRAEEVLGLRALRTRPHTPVTIADHIREPIARTDAARAGHLRSAGPERPPSDTESP